jgi:hypothetical protein
MRKRNPFALVMVMLAVFSWNASLVFATEAVVSFSGTVETVTDANAHLPSGVIVGAAVSGQFRYETVGSSVSFPFANYAEYTFADGGMSISVVIDGNTFTTTTPTPIVPDLELANDFTNVGDYFELEATTSAAFASDLGNAGARIVFADADSPYELFDSLDLPLTNADLAFAEASTSYGFLQRWRQRALVFDLSYRRSELRAAGCAAG